MTHGRKKLASHVKVPAKDKETTSRKDSKKASAKVCVIVILLLL